MKRIFLSFALVLLAGCQKKEAAPETAASTAPPPAVSIAPIKEPEPAMTASAAPGEPAASAPAAATAANEAPAAPQAAAAPAASAQADAKKPVASGSIQACCTAIQAAAKKGGRTKNQYASAGAVCAGLEKQLKAGKGNLASVKVTMRAQLAGVPLPNGC